MGLVHFGDVCVLIRYGRNIRQDNIFIKMIVIYSIKSASSSRVTKTSSQVIRDEATVDTRQYLLILSKLGSIRGLLCRKSQKYRYQCRLRIRSRSLDPQIYSISGIETRYHTFSSFMSNVGHTMIHTIVHTIVHTQVDLL